MIHRKCSRLRVSFVTLFVCSHIQKFNAMKDEFTRLRIVEEKSVMRLRQSFDERNKELMDRISELEEERQSVERVQEDMSNRAKQGYIELYEDLKRKSREMTIALKKKNEALTRDLDEARSGMKRAEDALAIAGANAEKEAVEATAKLKNMETRLDEAHDLAQKLRDELSHLRIQQDRKVQDLKDLRSTAERDTKEIVELSRSEIREMKAKVRHMDHRAILIEKEVRNQFERHCIEFESKLRREATDALEAFTQDLRYRNRGSLTHSDTTTTTRDDSNDGQGRERNTNRHSASLPRAIGNREGHTGAALDQLRLFIEKQRSK